MLSHTLQDGNPMTNHMADGAPDEEIDHNTSKADRSNSSDSDFDYTLNEYSSDSEDL